MGWLLGYVSAIKDPVQAGVFNPISFAAHC